MERVLAVAAGAPDADKHACDRRGLGDAGQTADRSTPHRYRSEVVPSGTPNVLNRTQAERIERRGRRSKPSLCHATGGKLSGRAWRSAGLHCLLTVARRSPTVEPPR